MAGLPSSPRYGFSLQEGPVPVGSALPPQRPHRKYRAGTEERQGGWGVGGVAISSSEDGDHVCMSAVLRVERAAALRFHPGFLVLRPLSLPRTVAEAHF